MSYCAVGHGYFTLKLDENEANDLKARMCAHYDVRCLAEQEALDTDSLKESVQKIYDTKKQFLNQSTPNRWLKWDLSDLGFSDIQVTSLSEGHLLEIEVTFNGKYHEDRIGDFLEVIAPCVIEGSFSFQGEDDALWRLEFTKGEWIEQSGEIVYANTTAAADQQAKPYPDFSEDADAFEALMTEIGKRLQTDDRSAALRGRALLAAFQAQNPDGVLLALTGWNLQSLGALARIWPDAEGIVLS